MVYSFLTDGVRTNYIVSFKPKDGFEEYRLSSFDHIGLTKKLLLLKVLESLSSIFTTYSYTHYKRLTDEQIEFTIEEFAEGKKVIFLTPYFFEEQNRFGFLVDFKFVKNEEMAFNKQIQRLSLSLDDNFRSNKNYYSDKFHLIQNFINTSSGDWSQITIDEQQVINISKTLSDVPSFLLGKKEYLFNINNTAYSQFQGIRNYGPYKRIEDAVMFVFIFESRFKSFANQLYLSLIGKLNPGTFSGFESMFKIKFGLNNVKQISLSSYNEEELKQRSCTGQNI
jgi:hypothetical protein